MVGVGYDLEHQRRRTDPATNEPLFTNCTRDFTGTFDYIFYTGWCMEPHYMWSLLFYDCSFCISIFLNKIIVSNCAYSFHDGHVCSFSADSLTVDSLLELLDEESLRKDTALPSPEWSSDHIALLAEFRCKPRIRR
jgi:CCR4-NOT transcription complex subunit 6